MDTIFIVRMSIYFLLITLFFSLLIAISTNNIFKNKTNKYIIPIYNLILFLDLVKINKFFVILYFIPIINLILIVYSLYRLSIMYNLNYSFSLGLMFLPIIYLPILNYKKINEDERKKLEDKTDSIALMSENEISALNESKSDEVKVDNVFKSTMKIQEDVPKFKANTIKYRQILLDDEKIEKIERVKPVEVKKIKENKFVHKQQVSDDDKIEILEL